MKYSFLFLLLPIVCLKIPLEVVVTLLCLGLSTILFHNFDELNMDNVLGRDIVYQFDQMNIIHTCIFLGFHNYRFSLNLCVMYLMEKFVFRSCYTCLFAYFITFLKKYSHLNLLFFLTNFFLYLNAQGRDFTTLETYTWHFLQGCYILLTLAKTYPYRRFFLIFKIK